MSWLFIGWWTTGQVAPHFSDEPLFTRFIGGEPPPSSLPPVASFPCARVRVWPGVALLYLRVAALQRLKKKKRNGNKQTNLKQKL